MMNVCSSAFSPVVYYHVPTSRFGHFYKITYSSFGGKRTNCTNIISYLVTRKWIRYVVQTVKKQINHKDYIAGIK